MSREFQIATLNKEGPPIDLLSLWGTRVQAENLLMAQFSEMLNQVDSVDHFLHHTCAV